MTVFMRTCPRCQQNVSTDDNKKVSFHPVSAGGRMVACPGKGS